MSIQKAIDLAIKNGATHIKLSPRQLHVFTRKQQHQRKGHTLTYKGARITCWILETPPRKVKK